MSKVKLMLNGKCIGNLKPAIFERIVSEGYENMIVDESIGHFELLWFIEYNKKKVREHYTFLLLNPEE